MRLGIVGATGWLGGALVRALLANGLGPASSLVLLNRSAARPPEWARPGVAWATDVADLVDRVEVVVLSVRPENFAGLGLRAPGRLVVSFMAGVPLAALDQATGGRVVRAMPNAAAERSKSYSPWLATPEVTEADRAFIRALLASIGTEDEVGEERHIDLLTALSGSGAAYPALMAMAMLTHARVQGLAEPVARRAVEAVVCEGAELLRGRIDEADDLVATYRSYRGTTAAGLDAAEGQGFSGAVEAALRAATAKAGRMWRPEDAG